MRPARPVGAWKAWAEYVPSGSASNEAWPLTSATVTSPFESVI